jgi:hypothetical protein
LDGIAEDKFFKYNFKILESQGRQGRVEIPRNVNKMKITDPPCAYLLTTRNKIHFWQVIFCPLAKYKAKAQNCAYVLNAENELFATLLSVVIPSCVFFL